MSIVQRDSRTPRNGGREGPSECDPTPFVPRSSPGWPSAYQKAGRVRTGSCPTRRVEDGWSRNDTGHHLVVLRSGRPAYRQHCLIALLRRVQPPPTGVSRISRSRRQSFSGTSASTNRNRDAKIRQHDDSVGGDGGLTSRLHRVLCLSEYDDRRGAAIRWTGSDEGKPNCGIRRESHRITDPEPAGPPPRSTATIHSNLLQGSSWRFTSDLAARSLSEGRAEGQKVGAAAKAKFRSMIGSIRDARLRSPPTFDDRGSATSLPAGREPLGAYYPGLMASGERPCSIAIIPAPMTPALAPTRDGAMVKSRVAKGVDRA